MIRPLDCSTVRRISSGQVITKVEDVVKELIENSIDAESTSIEVKLVGDGLTSITVKDNGVGIPVCDRQAMALRSHTSKIYNFEDLGRVETYGFRGEALNSICAVTESTQIITKTENDPVAILYTLDRSGKILHAKSSGSSPGTTVTAVKLFSNIPVRRQVAQKNSSSIGRNVQNLLITYALAHPHIRFSLKYENNSKLKFKEGDWIQPAMKNTVDAIIKLFGSELANEVQFGVWSSDHVNDDDMQDEQIQQCVVTLEAVLPKPDAIPHVIFKNGKAFIYINNRPVITTRGEVKSLVSMIKSVYNEIACQNGWTGSPKTPFMWINIKLPAWAYDINVEPSKNVVLFHHGEYLIENVSNLLEMLYNLNDQQKEQSAGTAMEVDQQAESVIDNVNVNSGNVYVEEIIVDPLERDSTKMPDNSIHEGYRTPSELYNMQSDNSSERDDQFIYSPVRSESSTRYSSRVSGTTTPIHDHGKLIMDSGVPSMERTSNDMRQYIRQETYPARIDKGKQKIDNDRIRERHNLTKKHDRVQYNNSNLKDGTIDNWIRNCQTQDNGVSNISPYNESNEPNLINDNDDEQGESNFVQSPSRYSRRLSIQSYNTINSEDIEGESQIVLTKNLNEYPRNNTLNLNQEAQLENCTEDSDIFVDGLIDKRDGYEIIDDDVESVHKRLRTVYNMENDFIPEIPENDLNHLENHDSTNSPLLLDSANKDKDNILQSETEVDANFNQEHDDSNESHQQLQRKEMGVRTVAIGQPTIDDLLKSGVISLDKNNNNVATNVNSQLQQLKKKSANDNRLSISLTDVLNQEFKLKFNKQRIIKRNKSTFKCSQNQVGYSLSFFNKLDYGMWTVTRSFNEKFMDILIVHGERIRELVTLETLVTSTELNPTRKLLNPIDVTVEQLGSLKTVVCLKRLAFDQIPDESGAGIWWNTVTQKCLTANGVKARWREDNGQIYIQITHISPLVQFATAIEYFTHLMKHLCCLNIDSNKDIPFVNARSRLTIQILAREAKQMVKHEDWTINKRDDEMKQRVKDATTYLMRRIQNFGNSSPDSEDNEIDELIPLAMVKKKNDEEIWYNGEMVVKILWKNI